MSATTIKVDTDTRDRLAALAKRRGETLGSFLTELVKKAEKEARWVEVRIAYERLQAEPEEWADYLAELHSWTEGSDGGIWADHKAAREEWPEYNA